MAVHGMTMSKLQLLMCNTTSVEDVSNYKAEWENAPRILHTTLNKVELSIVAVHLCICDVGGEGPAQKLN